MTSASLTVRWSSMFIETWATFRRASHSPIARTLSMPSAPPSRILAAIALASSTVAGGGELDVERDQRRPSRHEHGAGGAMKLARPKIGRQLTPLDPLGERSRASATQSGAGPATGEEAVQEHRNLLGTEHVGERERFRARRAAVGLAQEHDRGHVHGAHPWVESGVVPDVNPLDRRQRPVSDRRCQ